MTVPSGPRMMTLIVAYSQHPHTPDDLSYLRDCGFTHICYAVPCRHSDWQETASMVKSRGLKLVAALPDWQEFDRNIPCQQFQTKNGQLASSLQPSRGPSYWNVLAEQRALEHPSSQEVVQTLDAVIVAPRFGDVPFPSAWPQGHLFDFQYPLMFWSWDRWAKMDWSLHSDKPMPEFASCDLEGKPEVDPEFYRWYQAGWQNRVRRITDWCIGFGIKDIWTWMVPFNEWTTENMVWGVAGHFPLLDKWANYVHSRGCHPCFMLSCLWSVWPGRKAASIQNTRRFIEDYRRDVLIGTEACQSIEALETNLKHLGHHIRRIGGRGILASDRHILNPDNREQTQQTLRSEAALWAQAESE